MNDERRGTDSGKKPNRSEQKGGNKMKESIAKILTPALVIAAVIISGCGRASTSSQAETPPLAIHQGGSTVVAPLAALAVRADASTSDEACLDEMQHRLKMVIAGYVAAGQPSPEYLDYLYASAQSVEDAREGLRELEEQRFATQTYVNELIMGGQPVPDFEYAALESIEQARMTILRRIGLID